MEKKYFRLILLAFALANISIILGIPVIQQILGFLFFAFVPGLLVLTALRVNKISSWEYALYAIGLSILIMMVCGAAINFGYPLMGMTQEPLSKSSVLFSLDAIIILLFIFIIYRAEEIEAPFLPEDIGRKPKILFYVFPFLILSLSLAGIFLMNNFSNNILLMAMISLIGLYVLLIVLNRKTLSGEIYPLAIFVIALSLMLMAGLRSDHILGWDVHGETMVFQLAKEKSSWNPYIFKNAYNTCLSITILPTILQHLTAISDEYIYKLIFQIIFAFFPVGVYLLGKRFFDKIPAFIGCIFLMSQTTFTTLHISTLRNEIALLFFVLTFLALLNNELKNKHPLFLLFGTGLVLSHYSTAFIFLFLIAMKELIFFFKPLKKMINYNKTITFLTVLLFFAMIFFWYGQVTNYSFSSLIESLKESFDNMKNFFLLDARSPVISSAIGIDASESPAIYLFTLGIGTITRIFLTLGVIYLIFNFKKTEMRKDYALLCILSFCIFILAIIAPQISNVYNLERIYMLSLIFICPLIVLGGRVLFKRKAEVIITIIILIYFFNQIAFTTQIIGFKESFFLNSDCKLCKHYIVHDQEVASARWLEKTREMDDVVYGDYFGVLRIWSYSKIPFPGTEEDIKSHVLIKENFNITKRGFIYLRKVNIDENILIDSMSKFNKGNPISEYVNLSRAEKLYSNSGSQIYYTFEK
jgi:uncharacterized membrane protein